MSQFVRIDVPSPDAILDTETLGAGALLELQHSSTGGGAGFSTVDTDTIVAGQTTYRIYDSTGTPTTWYRTRFTDSAGANPSGFSAEFQLVTPLLTCDQFREFQNTSLPDGALQKLLDANTLAITQRAGPTGQITVIKYPRQTTMLWLDRPIQSIVSIQELFGDPVGLSGITLDATDYRIQNNGLMLERWGYGTNPGDWWGGSWGFGPADVSGQGRVQITYVPVDDSAERVRVLVALVKLDINRKPGISEERIGDYSVQQRFGNASGPSAYEDERESILATLTPSGAVFA